MKRFIVHIILVLSMARMAFAQPLSLRELTTQVQIPYESTGDFLLLDVKFKNVLPLKFIFDTGSEHTILFKKEYADLLGIRFEKRIPLMGSDLSQEIYGYIARGIPLNIEGDVQAVSDMLVLEENYLGLEEFTGINIDGIIGANLFRHYILFVNTRKGRIHLINPAKFKPPSNYLEIPVKIYKNKPYLEAKARLANNHINIRLLMDTGAGLPLLLYANSHPDLSLPEHTIPGSLGTGLGGNLMGYIGRTDLFEFGDYDYSNLITSFQVIENDSLPRQAIERHGIIGNSLLSRFNYYIDYHREILYIKPLRKFKRKFNFDKSGLVVVATGRNLRNFIVQQVMEDSPALASGLQEGDVIKKIQGVPSNFYSLTAINSLLSSREGKKIKLIIARENQRLKISFRLKNLI